MSSGWFVFMLIACITLCTGCVLAVALLRAAWSQREREALTSADLRALEESAVYLIEELKAEADRAANELSAAVDRCAALQELTKAADERIAALREAEAPYGPYSSYELESTSRENAISAPHHRPVQTNGDPTRRQILDLASSGVECAEIARLSGMGCAEVKLMLRLAGMRMN